MIGASLIVKEDRLFTFPAILILKEIHTFCTKRKGEGRQREESKWPIIIFVCYVWCGRVPWNFLGREIKIIKFVQPNIKIVKNILLYLSLEQIYYQTCLILLADQKDILNFAWNRPSNSHECPSHHSRTPSLLLFFVTSVWEREKKGRWRENCLLPPHYLSFYRSSELFCIIVILDGP